MASINKKFQSLPRLIQIILLFILVVNWLTEVIVRCSAGIHGKGFAQILVLIFAILPTGVLLGWIDIFSCLIQKKLILT